jgi:hypothetical protein
MKSAFLFLSMRTLQSWADRLHGGVQLGCQVMHALSFRLLCCGNQC